MKVKTEKYINQAKLAVITAFGFGLLVHLFGLVNVMHNNDDIWQLPMGYGTGLSSGRWLLTILGDWMLRSGYGYNLPLLNGALFLAMVAVSAGLVVDLFQIDNRISAVLMGMLFTAFPSVTSVLFFKYTAIHYGIAILLTVLAAWILERSRLGFLWSAVCTAMAMGIYQAYAPITITLFVLLLIQQALQGKSEASQIVKRGLYFCGALTAGVILYFLVLKGTLAVYGTALSDYQGVDNMGKLSLGQLPGLLKRTLGSFLKLPIYDYCGLANTGLLKILYLLVWTVSGGLVLYILAVKVRDWKIAVGTLLLCALLPFAMNFVVIMCPDTVLYTLMVYAFVLLPCIPLILLECLPENRGKGIRILQKAAGCIAALMVFCYAYGANVNYTSMYYNNRQVENYWNSIVTQVRMTEGFAPDMEWAVLGVIEDPMLETGWEYIELYGGNRHARDLMNQYSRLAWVTNYMGIHIPEASEDRAVQLAQTESVRQMPCWPSQGSIQIVEDTVVIKFQNVE